jgi:carbohydrate-selective porin OprB
VSELRHGHSGSGSLCDIDPKSGAISVPGFTIQPNLQYVFHPGQIVDRTEPQGLRAIPNAFVVGLRTTVKY